MIMKSLVAGLIGVTVMLFVFSCATVPSEPLVRGS